jgi:hypothetical protein
VRAVEKQVLESSTKEKSKARVKTKVSLQESEISGAHSKNNIKHRPIPD